MSAKSAMPNLVVLPGLDGTGDLLTVFAKAANKSFNAVTAVTYPNSEVLDYAALEQFARQSLPMDRPFVLLGESFSGPIALSIAANPPATMIGLVLSTSFAKNPVRLLRPLARLSRFAPIRALPQSVLSWLLLGRFATSTLVASLHHALQCVSPSVLRARAVATLRVDVSSRLSQITTPVLYLRATEDRLLSRKASDHILTSLPQARLAIIAGPHLLLQAAPTQCMQAIDAFVATLSLGKAG
jgi:pimeloyl-[acyl-carrier protein] methyl ester esterase